MSPDPTPASMRPETEPDFRWLKNEAILNRRTGEDRPTALRRELMDHFVRSAPPLVLGANVGLAAVLVVVAWSFNSHQWLLAWWCLQATITLGNGYLYHRYQQRKATDPLTGWHQLFCVGAIANGVNWGVGVAMFYSPSSYVHSIFIVMMAAGISSGVASVQTSLRAAFLGFLLPAMLLPAFYLLLHFGSSEIVPAGLMIFYTGALIFIGMNSRRAVVETIKLKFDNDELLAQVHGSERYFRALIENATDVVVVIDTAGLIIFLSPSARSVIGYRPDELTGLSLFDFIHADDVHGVQSTVKYLHKYPGVSTGGEARWRHRNGHWMVLEGNGRTLDIQPEFIVINARDVTERRSMENELRDAKFRAESASHAKSLFLANMSHEIRTPMHAILAMADVLRETSLDAIQQRHVSAFKNAGEHLLHLLNDLLDFSRIESGELRLARSPFHLPQLMETIYDLMWGQARSKNITLAYDLQMSVHPWRLGDPQRLRQIIVNLVNNAIKFTDDGEVMIRLSEAGEHRLLLEVIDTGTGIAPEHQSTIFESFVQAGSSVAERFGGAGLGLAICKRLVEAMDGTIGVESELGAGSRFYCELNLPAVDEPTELLNHRAIQSAVVAAKLPPASILVVDDSAMNRMVVEEYLRYSACRLDFAVNGQEAVEKIILYAYDLVIMDLRMPVMDGVTATRLIRQRESELQLPALPVIALTAGVVSNERESALAAGCTDYLFKPVSKDELTRVLMKYLAPKKSTVERTLTV